MSPLLLTIRRGAAALVLLSLSTAGLYPRVMGGEARANACATEHQTVCCCGLDDGGSCPMGCCQAPEPTREPAPAPPNRLDNRGAAFDLALAALAKIDDRTAAGCRGASSDEAASTPVHSLIALGVRLNI